MTRERRPSSAPPAALLCAPGSEPPPTEAEMRAAAVSRDAVARDEDPLALALRAAYAPAPLDAGALDALVRRALGAMDASASIARDLAGDLDGDLDGDLGAAVTPCEREAAAALCEGLAQGALPAEGEAALLGALAAAYRPRALDPAVNEALIARALTSAPAARPSLALVRGGAPREANAPREPARRAHVISMTATALASVAALAAGVALVSGKLMVAPRPPAPVAASAPAAAPMRVALIYERSTDELFDPAQRFEVGRQSQRIDRIASARAAELRRNRFVAWGVE